MTEGEPAENRLDKRGDAEAGSSEGATLLRHPGWSKPRRTTLGLTLAPLLIITIGNYVASAIFPALWQRHPAWLVVLSPTTRNLVLIAAKMSLWVYIPLAIIRRMIPHPLWFFIGRWYGDRAIAWTREKSPDIATVAEQLENWFPRFGWLICLLYPHPFVCVMAGASPMSFVTFMVVTLIGVIGFVVAASALGDALRPYLEPLARFGSHYWIPLTVATFAIVAISIVTQARSGSSQFQRIKNFDDDLNK